jgi:hypothetical protein
MGGRFRNLMPSNLLHPGACAVESLPAPGSEYASQMAKGELRRLFKRSAAALFVAGAPLLAVTCCVSISAKWHLCACLSGGVVAAAREGLLAGAGEQQEACNQHTLAVASCRDGCHHCGTRRGRVIGDHIPPNRLIRGPLSMDRAMTRLTSGLGISDAGHPAPTGRLQ